jgi:pyruvate dehydrogenase E2 component (dihydrolipoamide acetyltransferase)
MAEFVMPTLGSDMTEGTLVEWKKNVGDRVAKGEIIAEVDTEKAAIEVESFYTGVVQQLITKPGDRVPVGTVMAIIREEGAPAPAPVPRTAATAGREMNVAPGVGPSGPIAPAVAAASPVSPDRLRMSPAARQRAADLRIDPSALKGTGPGGAITLRDIEDAAQARGGRQEARGREIGEPLAPATPATDRQARMRETIAAAMARSKREIPHYYLSTTIDLERAMTWLKEENLRRLVTERLLYGVLLLKAVALALRQVPELNALWKGNAAVPNPDIHVGVAVSLRQGGLVAPALHHTDRQSLGELMKNFQDLVKRARAGTLRSSELSDPTITVTSLGEQGVDTVFGVIYPPQVALVGFGKVVERPGVVGGQVVPRPVVSASLSADHRVSDGHRGAVFLSAVDRLLQEPGQL